MENQNEKSRFGGNPNQWDIASHLRTELEELRYRLARYDDFWEWHENRYDKTEVEMFKEFEDWEDEQKDVTDEQIAEAMGDCSPEAMKEWDECSKYIMKNKITPNLDSPEV